MWCGKCYVSNPEIRFHVIPAGYNVGIQKEDGESEDGQEARLAVNWGRRHQAPDAYLRVRGGDHALVPFECDLCVFWKLTRRPFPD